MKASTGWTVAVATVAGLLGAATAEAGLGQGAARHAVHYQTLQQSHDGVWCEPAVVAVQSEAGWDEAMQELADQGVLMVLPAPAAPQVDWSHYTVVLVSMGGQSQRGAGVEVTGAKAAGRTLHLDVTLKAGSGGLSSDPSMPYTLVAVEKANPMGVKKVQLDYTLETPDGYMAAGENLPKEVAVEYGTQQVTMLSWGRLKADYR